MTQDAAPTIDIDSRERAVIQRLLRHHLPDVGVWAYGSRVRWNARPQSDLDLVAFSSPKQRSAVLQLREAFAESWLPFSVDLLIWDDLPESFHRNIAAEHVILQSPGLNNVKDGWRKISLGEFAPFSYGKSLPTGKRNPSGCVPVVGSNGVVGYHDSAVTDGPTVVIGRKGTVGAVNYFPNQCWPIDTTFYVTGDDADLTRFKFYALNSLGLVQMNSDSAVPGLNRDAAHARELLVPDEPEQRRIAHILGALDDKIELNRRMNETLEAMARAIFQDWFVDFGPVRAKLEGREPYLPPELWALFPNRLVDSELGEIPDGWAVKALGELIELAYGKALKAGDRKGGDIPVYGSNGQIGWHDERLVEGPGIVVGRKGNPGAVAWAYGDFFPIDTAFYVVPATESLSMLFLLHALDGQNLPAVAADSAVPGLNRNLAYMNAQLVPDSMMMLAFDSHATAVFTRRHRLEEESRALAAQRDALLPRLVSGELRVSG